MRTLPVWILLLSTLAGVGAAEDSPFTVTELTDNLHLLSTDQGEYTTTTLVFFGEDGLLLVDTQTEAEAEELKRLVDGYGKGTPKYIINTHRHVEHIGGNAIFGEDPLVIAHELIPQKLRSGSYIFNEYPRATFPDLTIAGKITLEFNGERIEIFPLAGSHDDNEIIVHFTEAKVVHLSSLVNGFNFPSIDGDGDALLFAPLVAQALKMLPRDVLIVSGHNRTGTWDDLQAYHGMLIETEKIVRKGLASGKDLEALQQEKALAAWEEYAGSYVSADEWLEYLVKRIRDGKDDRPTPHVPLYEAWKKDGAAAAVNLYRELKQSHGEEFRFDEHLLLSIGDKLYKRNDLSDAVLFLEASLEENPEGKYSFYAHYELAAARKQLGEIDLARQHGERSLALNPDFEPARILLEELGGK